MDATTQATVTSLVTAVLTIACTEGVRAIVAWRQQRSAETIAERKQRLEECSLDDDRADKMSQFLIGKLEARITALEAEVISLRKAYDAEVRAKERLQVQVEMLQRQQRSE